MDSDDEDCLFPNIHVVHAEPRPLFRPPFALTDFEEQIMCVDGKLDRVVVLDREDDDGLNEREERLDDLYSSLYKAGKQLLEGEYVAVLESPIAKGIIAQKGKNAVKDAQAVVIVRRPFMIVMLI